MIVIDGEYGEGGGQIVRTAIGLAALTGKACRVINIRARRQNPGLQEQHLQAVLAVAGLCQAEISGAERGSRSLVFIPKTIIKNKIEVKIATAGSVGLVLQALGIAAIEQGAEINISGGATFGKWAVPITYLETVLYHILWRYGYRARISVKRHGFYPRGGAHLTAEFQPWKPQSEIELVEQDRLIKIAGISIASHHLQQAKVAERQRDSALKILQKNFAVAIEIKIQYTDALNPGSAIILWAETPTSRLGADSLGERGKPAEQVGTEAAENLIQQWHKGAPLDSYAGDQILPFLALAGGRVKVAEVTEHCRTNIYVIQKFLPVSFDISNNIIKASKAS
ncbi:MAG: RNA 3'-terminal phosphate cyclase [Candidatus Sumerlaeia bacterium]|nr:RNA 3'-terminal phosphate cyclase [Candidatus Sumerlaeia bacterium]